MAGISLVKLPQIVIGSYWCQVNIGSGNGFGAGKQQAISWANVDPDRSHHMPSIGHSELTGCY